MASRKRKTTDNEENTVNVRDSRTKIDELEEGSWLSCVVYYHVKKIHNDNKIIEVTNDNGKDLRIGFGIVENETHSAKQYNRTEPKSTTELATILSNVKDKVFTVCFLKQQTDANVAKAIESVDFSSLNTDAKRRKFAREQILKGEERILTGHLIDIEEKLGRIQVWDLENNGPRQVDSRNIRWIITNDVKYVWNQRVQ
jgi:hypothetical protein